MTVTSSQVHNCRSCGSQECTPVLSLGETPIANSLCLDMSSAREAPRYSLGIMICHECGLVQLAAELPVEAIFTTEYPYYSSYSDELRKHSRLHADSVCEQLRLGPDSLVVEIGSNDGYLLREFRDLGIQVLGIDPSPGPADVAQTNGIPTVQEFFGLEVALRLKDRGVRPDVVIANNVMAHVPDLNSFVAGMAALATPTTTIQIENPYVRELVDNVEFDTIYHEHFCYFSCLSVKHLLGRHGLTLNDVEHFPVHGGTLRWTAGHVAHQSEAARAYLEDETALGVDRPAYYAQFANQVHRVQADLVATLGALRVQGSRIAAYGAAAKGATLLNSSGIGSGVLDFVADRNDNKQGKYMPGVSLPIVAPEAITEQVPDYVLLLAWNFKDEVLQQQTAYRAQGGRFIIPVPQLTII